MNSNVLIVDDDVHIRESLTEVLRLEGYSTDHVDSAEACIEKLSKIEANFYTIILTDERMPGMTGLNLITNIQSKHPYTKFILMTGHGDKQLAVDAFRSGAADYIEKPFEMGELLELLKKSVKAYAADVCSFVEIQTAKDQIEFFSERYVGDTGINLDSLSPTNDPSMKSVLSWVEILEKEALNSDAPEPSVLILGESGTGKEVLAHELFKVGKANKKPFIAINCASLSPTLIESELFGHEKGAFTGANQMRRGFFELANGGTLFLDEIGELDYPLQAKLLRVIQEKKFRRVGGTIELSSHFRLITATHQPLLKRVDSGDFRLDLYHRIAQVTIELPALRDRKSDLHFFFKNFLFMELKSRKKSVTHIDSSVIRYIDQHDFLGNFRELKNMCEQLALRIDADKRRLSLDDLLMMWPSPSKKEETTSYSSRLHSSFDASRQATNRNKRQLPISNPGTIENQGITYRQAKRLATEEFERFFVKQLLEQTQYNISEASRIAKMDRSYLTYLVKKYSLKLRHRKKSA